jgi:Flp pilus assembly protein TadD
MLPRLRRDLLALSVSLMAMAASADELADIEKLLRSGQPAEALRRTEAALAEQPRDGRLRFLKGVMLADAKRQDEALQIFTALTEDFPELADPYNNLAVIYAARGQLQAAQQALLVALRNDPTHRAARENLGDVYLALAQQSWTAAQAHAKGDDAELRRKLRLAREIQAVPAAAGVSRPPA